MASKKINLYPEIKITRIKNPSRLYAIPLFGWVLKCIMLLPVWIYLMLLGIANLFIWIINAFYILSTGTYWKVAYNLNVGLIRLTTKMMFFLYGMTDTYPGFSLVIDDAFSLAIPYPKKPSKRFAIPVIGFLLRFILLIPYLIYQSVISRSATIALVIGCFFVLFTGKYPESDFEINRDAFRLNQAIAIWFFGLSDEYPSFWISMNHQVIKITLIVISILLIGFNYSSGFTGRHTSNNRYQQNYYRTNHPVPNNYYPVK